MGRVMFDPRAHDGPSRNVTLNPAKFYKLVDIAKKVDVRTLTMIESAATDTQKLQDKIEEEASSLHKATSNFAAEARNTLRRKEEKSSFKDLLVGDEDPFADIRHAMMGQHYLGVLFSVFRSLQAGVSSITSTLRNLQPGTLLVGDSRDLSLRDMNDIQRLMFEIQLNEEALSRFITALMGVENLGQSVLSIGLSVERTLDGYHHLLVQRHTVDGVKIHMDPVITDVALLVYSNVDSHGEIEDGKKPDEVSAYSVQKAAVVINAVRKGVAGDFVKDPSRITQFVTEVMTALWKVTETIQKALTPLVDEAARTLGTSRRDWRRTSGVEIEHALRMLEELDPRNVVAKDKVGLLSPEEKFEIDFMNETLESVVGDLLSSRTSEEIVQWILSRKAELRRYHMEENSFYVCKMGSGNPFTGEAPGMLTVVPGTRPVVDLDEVAGSGFKEVKDFIMQVEESATWHDLFVATSPSRSGDKSNVLLIGPAGCGKSEVLRAVGGDTKSIGIFAQGSDFLTCWKGEAEKNPKRLFEHALKLQKDSDKHVHILIDEIDTILNDARGRDSFGGFDLRTEFQILMDGIVSYPHLSVWGATNNPERMPMPIIRRFNKVIIVGELDQKDRVRLLKQFTGFLPHEINDEHWDSLGQRLDGATGDVIRKVIDQVWREKMSNFTRRHKDEATKLVKQLNDKERFNVAKFSSDKRDRLHSALRPFVSVRADDIDLSVTTHLENVAIHSEIKTAVETYDRAKAFLNSLRASKNGVSAEEHPQPS